MTQTPAIALITGASRGIGHEVTRQLAAAGMTVYAAARDIDAARAALTAIPGDVRPLHLDVTDEASIHAAVQTVEAGAGRLDVLINNAGISLEAPGRPLDVTIDVLRTTYETNVFGVFAVTQAFLGLLGRSTAGRIVNVSSAVGSLSEWSDPESPIVKFAPVTLAYNTSKSALNALTVAYSRALAESGITVNAADPGYVATALNGHTGYRTVEEGAKIITQLATQAPTSKGAFVSDYGVVPW